MAVGLDLGSRLVKAVRIEGGRIVGRYLADTVPFLTRYLKEGRLDLSGLPWAKEMGVGESVVVTGYGRRSLAGLPGITEIRAQFRGALWQTGLADFTLVEVGGQDTKVVEVKSGRVRDFQLNDKCAAGTGRYLENMARLLGVGLAELSAAFDEPTRINNTCAIFGESEIIGQVVEGFPLSWIMAGVNDSVARRIAQMVRRYRPTRIVFTGGVAQNQGLVQRLEAVLDLPVLVPPEPALNGAIGCALEETSGGRGA